MDTCSAGDSIKGIAEQLLDPLTAVIQLNKRGYQTPFFLSQHEVLSILQLLTETLFKRSCHGCHTRMTYCRFPCDSSTVSRIDRKLLKYFLAHIRYNRTSGKRMEKGCKKDNAF